MLTAILNTRALRWRTFYTFEDLTITPGTLNHILSGVQANYCWEYKG